MNNKKKHPKKRYWFEFMKRKRVKNGVWNGVFVILLSLSFALIVIMIIH